MSDAGKQFLAADLWLVGCCAFYLLWWVLAFRPTSPITGFRSGWLLIPASVAGVVAVVLAIRAGAGVHVPASLIDSKLLVVLGVMAYVVLAAGTWLAFRRPVTTELILIVGWAVLALYEVDRLFGTQVLGRRGAIGFVVLVLVVLVICLVCYTVYYRLSALPGLIVGAVPLTLGAIVMAVLAVAIARSTAG
ncbi:hypothetical protein PACID_04460 [Acidipropionibacterium acidipropionici ATCC 4875]|uniref:Uncharacterized protein n=1 Tax=Acidipropionibacterium acidipropionici (strain ATCC 4875 / DSM 20272 / JCM 6432 / NBRC 12425 / NCIMB 8070 / 4) TaxID=1171373 RepID=K7RTR3_ACIA4|nr:hypothetical protein [Acidipropionibacterium acidipropionici]AFV88288.1 hypothetical protein PACID_04460 [Acidipropionibacterium acidipropionici ATCC 4875]